VLIRETVESLDSELVTIKSAMANDIPFGRANLDEQVSTPLETENSVDANNFEYVNTDKSESNTRDRIAPESENPNVDPLNQTDIDIPANNDISSVEAVLVKSSIALSGLSNVDEEDRGGS
jgi:hypothetical protein